MTDKPTDYSIYLPIGTVVLDNEISRIANHLGNNEKIGPRIRPFLDFIHDSGDMDWEGYTYQEVAVVCRLMNDFAMYVTDTYSEPEIQTDDSDNR